MPKKYEKMSVLQVLHLKVKFCADSRKFCIDMRARVRAFKKLCSHWLHRLLPVLTDIQLPVWTDGEFKVWADKQLPVMTDRELLVSTDGQLPVRSDGQLSV